MIIMSIENVLGNKYKCCITKYDILNDQFICSEYVATNDDSKTDFTEFESVDMQMTLNAQNNILYLISYGMIMEFDLNMKQYHYIDPIEHMEDTERDEIPSEDIFAVLHIPSRNKLNLFSYEGMCQYELNNVDNKYKLVKVGSTLKDNFDGIVYVPGIDSIVLFDGYEDSKAIYCCKMSENEYTKMNMEFPIEHED